MGRPFAISAVMLEAGFANRYAVRHTCSLGEIPADWEGKPCVRGLAPPGAGRAHQVFERCGIKGEIWLHRILRLASLAGSVRCQRIWLPWASPTLGGRWLRLAGPQTHRTIPLPCQWGCVRNGCIFSRSSTAHKVDLIAQPACQFKVHRLCGGTHLVLKFFDIVWHRHETTAYCAGSGGPDHPGSCQSGTLLLPGFPASSNAWMLATSMRTDRSMWVRTSLPSFIRSLILVLPNPVICSASFTVTH